MIAALVIRRWARARRRLDGEPVGSAQAPLSVTLADAREVYDDTHHRRSINHLAGLAAEGSRPRRPRSGLDG